MRLPPLRPRPILIVKAQLPGVFNPDLFDALVPVKGHVREDGVYVAPHHAHRRKRRPEPRQSEPASLDLFAVAARQAPTTQPPAPKPPAPERPAPALPVPALPAPEPAARKPAASPPTPAEVAPDPTPSDTPQSNRRTPFRPRMWASARTAAKRVAANKAAEAILAAKRDEDITDADLEVLAQYSGWGGCGTSPNEYFTPLPVASAMWAVLGSLGFRGGTVLEPSAGIGAFQQTAPNDTTVVAVELSPTSARINRLLHERAGDEVHQGTLEDFAGWDQRQFDAVIGNPPFGPRGSFRYDDLAPGKPDILRAEQYFLDTALDKTKDGGLVAMILPSGVMDNPSGREFRRRILSKGQLLAAWRLPNTAFADSQTSVTTDIVVFRKRPQAAAAALAALPEAAQKTLPHWNAAFVAGTYMLDGPGTPNVLGAIEPGWRAKAGIGDDITVTGSMADVAEHITAWKPDADTLADDTPTMASILDAAGDQRDAVAQASLRPPYPRLREGETKVVDGVLYVLRDHRWHRAEEPEPEIVADARRVGALLEPLIAGTAPDLALARAKAIKALDAFVAKHGNPAFSRTLAEWTSTPNLPTGGADPATHAEMVRKEALRVSLLLGAIRADGTYSDAIAGRDSASPAASLDTLAEHLALREGSFTAADLARLARQDEAAVADYLAATDNFALLPGQDRRWTTMRAYLQGELWPKYDAARASSENTDLPEHERERFRRQAEALLTAIAPLDLGDVPNIQLDSPFIPLEAIAAWKQAVDPPRWGKWQVEEHNGVYTVNNGADSKYLAQNDKLLEKVLMRRGIREDEMPLVEQMHLSFRDWLLADETWRPIVEDRYNRAMRGFIPQDYSSEPIEVPGLNPDFNVHAHQWRGVRWAMERGRGIIAADVGVGKTPRALILTALLRATGQAKKPVCVMPKSLLSNWFDMIQQMFPGARVLTIGENIITEKDGSRGSKEDDEAARRRKLADLAQNDYDFVLMTMPAWNMLNLDPERASRYADEDFYARRAAELEALSGSKKKRDQKRMEAIADEGETEKRRAKFKNEGEQNITLEQTGIDAVILDEGHSLKNLSVPEAGMFQSLKFLGAPANPAKQATNSFHKFRYIREKAGGRNVFLLTATPTKNSPIELYSMTQHVAPEIWTNAGIRNVDDFISRFVEAKEDLILDTQGTVSPARVVSGFRNLDEVRLIVRRYVDRTTAAEAGLKLPKPEVIEHKVEMDAAQNEVYVGLRKRLEAALRNRDAEGKEHPFSIMSDMQKAACDMRLYDPAAKTAPSPKLRAVAENAARLRKDGGQVIFADYVDAHGMIRDLLIAQGVPPEKIGIINASATPSSGDRQQLADRFNNGDLEVLIGNTATMGEGLNLQKRTADIHHVDIPWEPASMVQRNGRGLRQGNRNAAIRLHSYVSRGSFDGYRWQSMTAKADWQSEFWDGAQTTDNPMQAKLGRLEMLIMASADPVAARDALEAEMASAKDALTRTQTREAIKTWHRYREAASQVAAMEARRQPNSKPTQTEQAVRARRDRLKAQLLADPTFPYKDTLDRNDVLIDGDTGQVWKQGDEIESSRPLVVGSQATKWVVASVHPLRNTATLIPDSHAHTIGTASQHPGFRVSIADLRDTTPTLQ